MNSKEITGPEDFFNIWRNLANRSSSRAHSTKISTNLSLNREAPSLLTSFMEQILAKTQNIPFPLMLYKSKGEETFFIGFGNSQSRTDRNAPKDFYYFGGNSFYESNNAKEWQQFGTQKFIAPLFGIYANKTSQGFALELFVQLSKNSRRPQEDISIVEKSFHSPARFFHSEQSFQLQELPNYEAWKSGLELASRNLQNPDDDLKKIVLSRKVTLKRALSQPSCDSRFLKKLFNSTTDSYFYFFRPQDGDFLVSVTPEKLFSLKENHLTVDAIAGTRKRGSTSLEDETLGEELQNSEKDLREHRFVKKHVQQKLETLGAPKLLRNETLLPLQYVQHLYSEYSVELKKPFTLKEICQILHPTPAVGGTPTKLAKKALKNLEEYERGWYAAPLGFTSPHHTEMVVGIRSALKNIRETEETWHVYAGAGIVKGSCARAEWEETGHKMKNFLNHLLPQSASQPPLPSPSNESLPHQKENERTIHG